MLLEVFYSTISLFFDRRIVTAASSSSEVMHDSVKSFGIIFIFCVLFFVPYSFDLFFLVIPTALLVLHDSWTGIFLHFSHRPNFLSLNVVLQFLYSSIKNNTAE